jgi:CheY-like chemotaxis protein
MSRDPANQDSLHLLLVEDNSADATLLTEFFIGADNAPLLHWVNDGGKALDYLRRAEPYKKAARPDAVLLDLGLPRVNGYEVLQNLQKEPGLANIPVIVLTTSHNPTDKAVCTALGAAAYYTKPYNLAGYEELIEDLMENELPRLRAEAEAGQQAASTPVRRARFH